MTTHVALADAIARAMDDGPWRAARRANAETVHAERLAELRAIVASDQCSDFEKNRAQRYITMILGGELYCEAEGDDAKALRIALLKARAPASAHVGAAGDKVERTAIFEAMIPFHSEAYGTNWLHKFRAADGAILTWLTKACDLRQDDLGATVRIKGAVKAHKEYRGVPETALVRCKVARVPAE